MKLNRRIDAYEEELRRNTINIDKSKASIHKITTAQTNFKFNKNNFALKEDILRLKENVNRSFNQLLVLHESAIDRDAVICESLLDTQLGKLKRLIVKRSTHD